MGRITLGKILQNAGWSPSRFGWEWKREHFLLPPWLELRNLYPVAVATPTKLPWSQYLVDGADNHLHTTEENMKYFILFLKYIFFEYISFFCQVSALKIRKFES